MLRPAIASQPLPLMALVVFSVTHPRADQHWSEASKRADETSPCEIPLLRGY